MAPPMKELPRWLLDNPEFSVAPDWTDIVKQSVSNFVVLPIDGLFYSLLHYCLLLPMLRSSFPNSHPF